MLKKVKTMTIDSIKVAFNKTTRLESAMLAVMLHLALCALSKMLMSAC